MLRRAPTAITLGESDLRDFKVRAQCRRADERENHKQELERPAAAAEDGPRLNTRAQKKRRSLEVEKSIVEPFNRPLTIQTQAFQNAKVASTIHNQYQTGSSTSLDPFSDSVQETTTLEHTAEELDVSLRPFSPENIDPERYSPSSPPKNDDFHYGGFVESPSEDYSRTRTSSFGTFSSPWPICSDIL
jgi:hypothetical protein